MKNRLVDIVAALPVAVIALCASHYAAAQPIALGPKSGSVPSGVIVSTSAIVPSTSPRQAEEEGDANPQVRLLPPPKNVRPPRAPMGSNYTEDRVEPSASASSRPVILDNFPGIVASGWYPPDPVVAVGDSHVIECVNNRFRIWDKTGNILQTIDAFSWFASTIAVPYITDPKIVYDQFADRWVIVWLRVDYTAHTAHYLISVSDDGNPLGAWFNWALPSNAIGDSLVDDWGDYEGLGYDDKAIYITSNQFPFTSGFTYVKVRVIPKAQLYGGTAGAVSWNDFWDLRDPDFPPIRLFNVRPARTFDAIDREFLLSQSPFNPGTYMTLWAISNPLTTPSLTAVNVPVTEYRSAYSASQPGGGTPIEIYQSLSNEPVCRDSSLWMVHTVASGTSDMFASVEYIRFDPFTPSVLEDAALGQENYWYFDPAIMVDQSNNAIISFTRSGSTEYAGAYLTGRKSADPPGLSPSVMLKTGAAFYESLVDGRNRWGDYNGTGLDPTDENSVWVVGEYVAGTNSWGTRIGRSQMGPVAGKAIFAEPAVFNFTEAELGHLGDTLTIFFTNNGVDTLVISGLDEPDSNFSLLTPLSLPLSVATFQEESLKVRFNPKTVGNLTSTLVFHSNDTYNSALTVNLSGPGYHIIPAVSGTMYAGTGVNDFGRLITVDPVTGAGSVIGQSGFEQLYCLKIHPGTKELWGLLQVATSTLLLRVNSAGGDAHQVLSVPTTLIEAMAFRGDSLYLGRVNGIIYRVDLGTGSVTQVASTGLKIAGLDVNPITGELWASIQTSLPPDRIYKIDLNTGIPTLVGRTNLNVQTPDIAFDGAGNLFGIIGTGPQPCQLILIDTLTGGGTIMGNIGVNYVQGLAIDPEAVFPVHSFRFTNNWNLFSVPLRLPEYALSTLFPGATATAYAFEGKYFEQDTVPPGRGFWLKFNSSYVKSVIGEPIDHDSIDVLPSWNLIGSVSDAVPTSGIASIPPNLVSSAYYTYDGGGYVALDSLLPGYGHWVKTAGAGKLLLDAPLNTPRTTPTSLAGIERGSVSPAVSKTLQSLHSLTLRDALGHTQRLYFGDESRTDIRPSMYELPPASPDGFDTRFASNRMVELHPSSVPHIMEFPIRIQSLGRPVTFSWDVELEGAVHYALVFTDKKSGRTSILEIHGEGDMSLPIERLSDVKLRAYEKTIPEKFALLQNYPNPFNPVTTIRYELPGNAHVRLAVFDILGNKVATLVDGLQEAGYYSVAFDGGQLASGIYFYRLEAGQYTGVQKMTVMK